jgi:hypothetical protein
MAYKHPLTSNTHEEQFQFLVRGTIVDAGVVRMHAPVERGRMRILALRIGRRLLV